MRTIRLASAGLDRGFRQGRGHAAVCDSRAVFRLAAKRQPRSASQGLVQRPVLLGVVGQQRDVASGVTLARSFGAVDR